MNKIAKISIAFVVSGICIWFAFRDFHFSELKTALDQTVWIWFLPATVIYIGEFFVRTLRWRILFSPLKKTKPFELFPVLTLGFFMNVALPARAGEFARALAAHRVTSISMGSCLGSIAAERVSDLAGLFIVMLFSARLLPWEKLPLVPLSIILTAAAIFTFVAIFLVKRRGIQSLAEGPGLKGRCVRFFFQVIEGFIALRSFRKIGWVFLLTITVWFMELSALILISFALGLNLSYLQAAVLLIGISFGVMIPAAPGYVGTYELFGKQTLMYLGFSASLSLSFVLLLHSFQMIMISLMGIPSLIKLGVSKQPTGPMEKAMNDSF